MDKHLLHTKKGMLIDKMARDFLTREENERLEAISVLQEKYDVSRGTIQNALNYLKEIGAVQLISKGHLGTFFEYINHKALQKCLVKNTISGIMPLPYSKLYEGLATALYLSLKDSELHPHIAYSRGATSRIEVVVNESYDFAICSKYAAIAAIEKGEEIEIVLDFGSQSYLSEHVIVFNKESNTQIEDGLRMGIDVHSYDQKSLTHEIIKNSHKKVELVNLPSHQVIQAIHQGIVDAGIWNLDEIEEKGHADLKLAKIPMYAFEPYSNAVIVIKKNNTLIKSILTQYLNISHTRNIQSKVKNNLLIPSY